MSRLTSFQLRTGAALTIAAVITGCSSATAAKTNAAATSAPAAGPTSASATNASTATTLIVYSAQGYDAPVTKAFSQATGIPVKLVDDSTGPLLTKVAAEKNNPQWGLLWVDGDTAFAALDKQGQLLPYTPAATLNTAGQSLVPSDHSYVPVSTTVMAALIYNAARVTAIPATYQDLLGPQYTGKVGMNDPSQSGPTFPFIAGLMNQLGGQSGGVAAGESYLKKLKANGLHVFPTNGDTLHALETGQIDYGLIQSSAATGEVTKAPTSASFNAKVDLPAGINAAARRDRHRQGSLTRRPGGGQEVRRLRALPRRSSGHAEGRPHRRLAVLACGARRQRASCPATLPGQVPADRPLFLGTAGERGQHVL